MREWLLTHDPRLDVTRRAVRIAVVTCVAFYLGVYLLELPVVGVYGAFTGVAFGGLSEVGGTPRQRTRTLALAGLVAAALVTVGTYLSVSTLAATAGMVVVGFLVSFAGVGGPRVAGVSNGWQLFYILPSFPPYDPGSLGARLLGLGIGLGLLLAADRWLLPPRVPHPYREVLADAVAAVGDRLAVVRPLMTGRPASVPALDAAAQEARHHVDAARLSAQPMLQRPSGPSRRDRALWSAASATRLLAARVDDLQVALLRPEGAPRRRRGEPVLEAAQRCVQQCVTALRGGAVPDVADLDRELARVLRERERWLVDAVGGDEPLTERVAVGTAAHEVAEATRVLAEAVTIAVAGRLPPDATPVDDRLFWYAAVGPRRLLGVRVRGQLTFRSVWLRNAIRVAVALGAARAVAGVMDLSHGFWVLLATLTLMRTTVTATRAAVGPALRGTLVGAALAVPLLVAFGGDSVVLAVLLPVLVAAAFAGGPLLGPAYGPIGLTLTVAVLFAQVSPADWSLAGWRLLDVMVGAAVGVLAGLLAWPRGASGQLLAQCRDALRRCSGALVRTTEALVVGAADLSAQEDAVVQDARRSLLFAGETIAFAMAEPVDSGLGSHWRELLDCCHHMVEGGQYVRQRRQGAGPVPWPRAQGLLEELAGDAAERAERLAAALPGRPARHPVPSDDIAGWLRAVVTGTLAPPAVLDVIDARGWLVAVRRDLDRMTTP